MSVINKVTDKAVDAMVAAATNEGLANAVSELVADLAKLKGEFKLEKENNAELKKRVTLLEKEIELLRNENAMLKNEITTLKMENAIQKREITLLERENATFN